jgi:hypothetical protein
MDLRHEALLMLENRGTVLDTARKVSRLLKENHISGAIIGGIAVFLHGHVRTTKDVDVLVPQPLSEMGKVLQTAGATFDSDHREYLLDGVPVQLVSDDIAVPAPKESVEIDGVLTIGLADLINLKLHSGMKNVTRAQDIADVIGLIRQRQLTGAFAAKLEKSVRNDFEKLVKAVKET